MIEEVGEGVSDSFSVGDRVVVQPIIYDGTCGSCEEGLVNCCDNNGFVGLSGKLVLSRRYLPAHANVTQVGEEVCPISLLCQSTAS
jgi:threonine dehydrogenase-like Zn-dependent dehydrogenase